MSGSKKLHMSIKCEALPDGFCTAFSEILSEKGLKSLFIKNVLEQIAGETEEDTKRRIIMVIMRKFKIVMDDEGNRHNNKEHAKNQSGEKTVLDMIGEELDSISEEFSKLDNV